LEKSKEVEREPQRLLQIEAMRERVSKCATAKEKGNNTNLMRVKQALPTLLSKYLKDLETDEKDRLSPDVAKTWKQAALDLTGDVLRYVGQLGVNPASGPDDALGPLRRAIGKIASLTEAVTKGVQEPDEEELRDLARKLGVARKEIMVMSRALVVNQPATAATEAHELASEAGEAIRASRETIKAALGEWGQPRISLRSAASPEPHAHPRRGPPCETWHPLHGRQGPTGDPNMAPTEHPSHLCVAPPGHATKTNPRRSRGRAGYSHARVDGSSGK
jgi:hypothetical protein